MENTPEGMRRLMGIPGVASVLIVNLMALAVLVPFLYAWRVDDIAFSVFTIDEARVPVDRWYAGLLSNIGIAVWYLAAPAALVAAFVSRRSGRDAAFFVAAAVISAWLATDDLMSLHEEVIPDATGVDEKITFGVYALVVAAVVAASMATIRRHLGWLLAGALILLGFSLFVAKLGIGPLSSNGVASILKFFGIVNWTWFFTDAAARSVRRKNG